MTTISRQMKKESKIISNKYKKPSNWKPPPFWSRLRKVTTYQCILIHPDLLSPQRNMRLIQSYVNTVISLLLTQAWLSRYNWDHCEPFTDKTITLNRHKYQLSQVKIIHVLLCDAFRCSVYLFSFKLSEHSNLSRVAVWRKKVVSREAYAFFSLLESNLIKYLAYLIKFMLHCNWKKIQYLHTRCPLTHLKVLLFLIKSANLLIQYPVSDGAKFLQVVCRFCRLIRIVSLSTPCIALF